MFTRWLFGWRVPCIHGIFFHILTSDVVIKLSLCLVLVFVKENLPEVAWRACILSCLWIVEKSSQPPLDMSSTNLAHSVIRLF